MIKNIVVLVIAFMSAAAFAGGSPNMRGDRATIETYHALTYIIATDTPPPISQKASLDLLKNHTADALAEHCYYAGQLELRLNNIFVKFPSAGQSALILRGQLQTLIEAGMKSLRDVCSTSEANKKLPTLQRITNVENLVTDIRNEAIALRTKLQIHK